VAVAVLVLYLVIDRALIASQPPLDEQLEPFYGSQWGQYDVIAIGVVIAGILAIVGSLSVLIGTWLLTVPETVGRRSASRSQRRA